MPKQDPMDVFRDRLTEQYLLNYRNSAIDTFSDWKGRIEEVDRQIRGEFTVTYPDGTGVLTKPMVMNLMDTMPRDVARLVTEAIPSANAQAASDSDRDIKNALMREAIADTHWMKNNGPLLIPQHAMDLVITGTAFQVCWFDSRSPYPHIDRVDPRFCYPDVVNGVMQDLLVRQKIKYRVLQRMYPDYPIEAGHDDKKDSDFYEVWDYYSAEGSMKAVARMSASEEPRGENALWVVNRTPGLGCIPAAFVQLPSPDGGFRGMLDQIGGSIATKNRILQYTLDYAHQMLYAPWEEKGILNPDIPMGPDARFHHDPQAQGQSFMRRINPAGTQPELFNLLQYLDTEQRAQAAYPSARQGEVPARADSAPFVTSMQGQLTSVIRDIQRLLGSMREQITYATMKIDEEYLDGEKPLYRPVVDRRTYTPSKDIKGQYDINIVYGAGAGLDRQSADVRLLQYYSNGLLSGETTLENTDIVGSAPDEIERRQTEELEKVALQRFAGDPSTSLDFLIQVIAYKKENGVSFVDALIAVQQQQAAQPQPGVPGAGVTPGAPPTDAAAQQLALEKGATQPQAPAPGGGAPPIPGSFQPDPLQQVIVR